MAGLLVVFFPFVLLGFMVIMERVEIPLRGATVDNQVEDFLDRARPDELDAFVREGLPALNGRGRLSRLLPLAPRRGRRAVRASTARDDTPVSRS